MHANRTGRILKLAIPIILGMMSQNILNLVDTFMVGFLGNSALAAVGLGGFANFMCMSLILGVSVGVQATAARRKGEGKISETAGPLNTGLVLVLVAGLLLSSVIYFQVPSFYPYLNSDPEVIREGVPYLQIRILAMVFVGMNFSFRGYWNAVDLSRLYMSTLIVMHISNIIMNYMFIFGKLGAPEMGVTGAGLATSLSIVLGTCVYFILGCKYARHNGFLKSMPTWSDLKKMALLSLPNSIQQLFFSAGFTATYWIIGKVGTVELAAANVLINVTLVAILPALAMGLSATTLVGQALGRKDSADAAQWAWDVAKLAMIGIGLLGLPMILIPELILSIFLHDPATLEIAKMPMRVVGLTISIDAMGMVLMHALLGAGATKRVMIVSIGLQWLIFLPAAYLLGPVLGYGLLAIWILQGSYRMVQAFIFNFIWRQGSWSTVIL